MADVKLIDVKKSCGDVDILKGVDLIGSNTTDQQIIQALLTNNKLIVD